MTISRIGRSEDYGVRRRLSIQGLTLIELIAVMAVLATVLAISAPRLARFAAGRSLREESRRFLALARYGRSEAIARAAAMELWIDPELRAYGLEEQADHEDDEALDQVRPLEFELAGGLDFDVNDEDLDEEGRAAVMFWPDGSIDEESPDALRIVDEDEMAIAIEKAEFGLGYFVSGRAKR